MSWREPPHVYFLRPVGQAGPVKIGWSCLPTERLKTFQSWSPIMLELVARLPGDGALEARFHAHFAHLHLHGEWFAENAELSRVIAEIAAGTFNCGALPARGRRLGKKVVRPEAVDAARYSRRLDGLQRLGVQIPAEVIEARHTYGYRPEEVARRRAVVRAFVDQHDHLTDAAKKASAAWRRERGARVELALAERRSAAARRAA